MTGALLLLGAALAAWPGRRTLRQTRVAGLTGSRNGGAPGRPRSALLPLPLVAGCAGAVLAVVASTPLVAALAGAAASLAARAWERRRAVAAEEARLAGLAEALGALAAELRSGRSLEEATDAAVAVCAEEESGRALARAVRAPVDGGSARGEEEAALRRVSAAVLLSGRTGCSLAAVVGAVEDDVRARRRHRLDLHSALAGPRASAVLLAGLPVLGLLMGSGVGADPWRVLTTTVPGQALLVVGVALEAAGLAWSARLTGRALR
ncbi:type II secretion system F family protein [Geodermatophilus ruber]|uniref:Tight adherence protein B n=1 Tax=Geodermatophilus ruber TaxID=504800 RepID=A0A1I4D8L2_9ACTN|nr:type II secretion system F family protein [Geodermatophilus ruber]SFK89199.1 tight adherence protein B [Geodermatophilus ruber]